jgi:membrane-associated phospholipid phosphatase
MEAEPKFLGPFSKTYKDPNGKTSYSSFPSGHTTVAFAAATVFAKEYNNTPIIGVIAYSAATLVGLSRITENAHWASDVFVGATVGYLAGREVVNNYHRFMKIRQPKKGKVSFMMQPFYGKLLPGLVYNFK